MIFVTIIWTNHDSVVTRWGFGVGLQIKYDHNYIETSDVWQVTFKTSDTILQPVTIRAPQNVYVVQHKCPRQNGSWALHT